MASHIAKIRLLDELDKLVSTIFSPLLTPSYGLFLALSISPKVLDTTGARIKLLIIFFGITCVLPMATIAVLHNIKLIKDKKMIKREERTIPYIAGTIYYAIAVWYCLQPRDVVAALRHEFRGYKPHVDDILHLCDNYLVWSARNSAHATEEA